MWWHVSIIPALPPGGFRSGQENCQGTLGSTNLEYTAQQQEERAYLNKEEGEDKDQLLEVVLQPSRVLTLVSQADTLVHCPV